MKKTALVTRGGPTGEKSPQGLDLQRNRRGKKNFSGPGKRFLSQSAGKAFRQSLPGLPAGAVLLPVAEAIGVDPIHFGIIMCVNLAIGFVTPPMGANLFVASNLSKVSVFDIARKAVPFILAFLIALLLITFVPQISMFLLQ